MSQDDVDFAEHPRKAFRGFLLYQLQPIVIGVYGNSSIMRRRSLSALMGLIDSLNTSSKEALATSRKDLEEMFASGQLDDKRIQKAYGDVTNYLHRTYLAEVNWFKPMNPKPKHIGTETDE